MKETEQEKMIKKLQDEAAESLKRHKAGESFTLAELRAELKR